MSSSLPVNTPGPSSPLAGPTQSPIRKLPPELLARIFLLLVEPVNRDVVEPSVFDSVGLDLYHCLLVSSSWHDLLLSTPHMWRHVGHPHSTPDIRPTILEAYGPDQAALDVLELTNYPSLQISLDRSGKVPLRVHSRDRFPELVEVLRESNALDRVEHVTIYFGDAKSFDGCQSLAECHRLTDLVLPDYRKSFLVKGCLPQLPPTLRVLKMSSRRSRPGWFHLVPRQVALVELPVLEVLHIRGTNHDLIEKQLSSMVTPALQVLSLETMPSPDVMNALVLERKTPDPILPHLSSVRVLKLLAFPLLVNSLLWLLPQLPNTEVVELSFIEGPGYEELPIQALRGLCFKAMFWITAVHPRTGRWYLPRLRTLRLDIPYPLENLLAAIKGTVQLRTSSRESLLETVELSARTSLSEHDREELPRVIPIRVGVCENITAFD